MISIRKNKLSSLKIAYNKIYKHDLGIDHRFPMEKYDLIPKKLISSNVVSNPNFFDPVEIDEQNIFYTHDKEYYKDLINFNLTKNQSRSIGFPLTRSLIENNEHSIVP